MGFGLVVAKVGFGLVGLGGKGGVVAKVGFFSAVAFGFFPVDERLRGEIWCFGSIWCFLSQDDVSFCDWRATRSWFVTRPYRSYSLTF